MWTRGADSVTPTHAVGVHPILRPGLAVYRRNTRQLQFGTAPDDCFVVEDRPGLVALLRLLNGMRDAATVACLARERIPALVDDPEALLGALAREGIVVDAPRCHAAEHALGPEARSLVAQRVMPDEVENRLMRRSQSYTEIRADGPAEPFAAGVADALRATGIDTTRASDTLATVVVVVSTGQGDRSLFARLRHDHLPHLAVAVCGSRVDVGPFVCPGLTPCVECLDLWRHTSDPSWAAVTAQFDAPLVYAGGMGDTAVSAATRLAATALVTDEVATFCDDTVPHTTATTITIGPGAYDRAEAASAFHPRCRCREVRGAAAELDDPPQ